MHQLESTSFCRRGYELTWSYTLERNKVVSHQEKFSSFLLKKQCIDHYHYNISKS